jgi:hypothetical protein
MWGRWCRWPSRIAGCGDVLWRCGSGLGDQAEATNGYSRRPTGTYAVPRLASSLTIGPARRPSPTIVKCFRSVSTMSRSLRCWSRQGNGRRSASCRSYGQLSIISMDVMRMFSKIGTTLTRRPHPTATAASEPLVVRYCNTACHGTRRALASRRIAPPASRRSWPFVREGTLVWNSWVGKTVVCLKDISTSICT